MSCMMHVHLLKCVYEYMYRYDIPISWLILRNAYIYIRIYVYIYIHTLRKARSYIHVLTVHMFVDV